MNTVEFSNHTGYGAWRGRTAPAEQVADIVQGIEALGLLATCDALLTGYVGDAALGDVVLATARKVRAAASGSLASLMARTTATPGAPARTTWVTVERSTPPMANHGMRTFPAAHRTYSRVTGLAPGLVPVA